MKTLIVTGCSWTDGSIQGFPRHLKPWGKYLAERLNMNLVNLGNSGSGNEGALSRVLDYVALGHPIDLVVAMWTEQERIDWEGDWTLRNEELEMSKLLPNEWFADNPERNTGAYANPTFTLEQHRKFSLTKNKDSKDPRYNGHIKKVMVARKQFRTFYMFQELMKAWSIPYFQTQGTNPITHFDERAVNDVCKEILRNEYTEKLDNRFIGWPIFEKLGGTTMNNMLDNLDKDRTKYRVHPKDDSHPNEAGNELIADYLYKEIKKCQ